MKRVFCFYENNSLLKKHLTDNNYSFNFHFHKMTSLLKSLAVFSSNLVLNSTNQLSQQVRHKWADWRMIKDYRKRLCVKEHAVERLRINSLRKNNILPIELREIADAEIAAFPRNASITRIRPRCSLTSRPRGTVNRFRISRIVWRHLADYNKLSGVQRAMW